MPTTTAPDSRTPASRTTSAPSPVPVPLAAVPVAGPPPWVPRTAAGARAVRRRRARIRADRRPPSGVLPSTNRTAVPVSAGKAGELGEGGFRLGRWARLASTLTLLAAGVAVGIALLSGGASYGVGEVTVQPGDTLWSIALRAEPEADPRSVVEQILRLNGLDDEKITAGTALKVPTRR